jgi:hypothetical protein
MGGSRTSEHSVQAFTLFGLLASQTLWSSLEQTASREAGPVASSTIRRANGLGGPPSVGAALRPTICVAGDWL